MVSLVIHTNPHLANQRETAAWLQEGFRRHGIEAEITADRAKIGDINVVQGPHWALREFTGRPRTLFLNRTFWGHPRWYVSVGWLNPDGSRDFLNADKAEGKGRLPVLKALKRSRRSAVVFGDYGRDATEDCRQAREKYDSVFFRPHPAQTDAQSPVMVLRGDLESVFALGDVAIGHSSTVLVDAAIHGLHVECSDPLNVVHGAEDDRELWLKRLSWANWHHGEIQRGEMWEHLNDVC